MAKVVLGVSLALAGISLFIVSIWMLVDTKHPRLPRMAWGGGYSPKIGIAASTLLVIMGVLCCCINKANLRRSVIFIGVFLAFGLTVSSFGIAVKDRIDMKNAERLKVTKELTELLTKYETQLVVMAVIAGLDIIVELVALITAYKWKERYP